MTTRVLDTRLQADIVLRGVFMHTQMVDAYVRLYADGWMAIYKGTYDKRSNRFLYQSEYTMAVKVPMSELSTYFVGGSFVVRDLRRHVYMFDREFHLRPRFEMRQ